MAKGQKSVLSKHTYFHRVAKMLTEFGLSSQAEVCLDTHKNILGHAGIRT